MPIKKTSRVKPKTGSKSKSLNPRKGVKSVKKSIGGTKKSTGKSPTSNKAKSKAKDTTNAKTPTVKALASPKKSYTGLKIAAGIGAGLVGTVLLSKLAHKVYVKRKAYEFNKSVSIVELKLEKDGEGIKINFDPEKGGSWKGEPGLAILYLKEYLLKKFNNACTFPDDFVQIRFDSSPGFAFGGIIKIHNGAMVAYPKHNAEDMASSLKGFINDCSKRFVVIPIAIFSYANTGHANLLIVDKQKKVIEHYDPYGSNGLFAALTQSNVLSKRIEETVQYLGYTFVPLEKTCPLFGPQSREELYKCSEAMIPQIQNKIGLCLIWSLFFIHLRLTYPDLDPKETITKSIKSLSGDFCKFIKAYAQEVIIFSEKYDIVKDKNTGMAIDYVRK